jgi:hypothetical protein
MNYGERLLVVYPMHRRKDGKIPTFAWNLTPVA